MTDNNMPELTLTPSAAAQAEVPQLTLGTEPPATPGAEEKKEVEPVQIDESMLTEAERKMVTTSPRRSTSATARWSSSTAPPPRRAWPPSRRAP